MRPWWIDDDAHGGTHARRRLPRRSGGTRRAQRRAVRHPRLRCRGAARLPRPVHPQQDVAHGMRLHRATLHDHQAHHQSPAYRGTLARSRRRHRVQRRHAPGVRVMHQPASLPGHVLPGRWRRGHGHEQLHHYLRGLPRYRTHAELAPERTRRARSPLLATIATTPGTAPATSPRRHPRWRGGTARRA